MSIRTKEVNGDISGAVRLGIVGFAAGALLVSSVGAYERLSSQNNDAEITVPASSFTARGLVEIYLNPELLSAIRIPRESIREYRDRVTIGELNVVNGSVGLSAVAFNTDRNPQTFLGGSVTISSDTPIDPAIVLKPKSETEAFPLTTIVTSGNNSLTIDFKLSK